jgi:hypothetical protein
VELYASFRGRCDPTRAAHTLESSVSQEENVARLNSPDFGIEISSTSSPFTSLRRTVTWRSTLDHVSNVNSLGIETGVSEFSIEDLPCPAAEDFSCDFLIFSWCLPNYQDAGLRIPSTHDADSSSVLVELTLLTVVVSEVV